MITDLGVLDSLRLGSGRAELETSELNAAFIPTSLLLRLADDQIDVVLGGKGTGKSALYWALLRKHGIEQKLKDVVVVPVLADDPDPGAVLPSDVAVSFATEVHPAVASGFWAVFLLGTAAERLASEVELSPDLLGILRDIGITAPLGEKSSWRSMWRLIVEKPLEQASQAPTPESLTAYGRAWARIFDLLEADLARHDRRIWLAIDRLDETFHGDWRAEGRALRALLEAVRHINARSSTKSQRIRVKAFLRSDVLSLISEEGLISNPSLLRPAEIVWDIESVLSVVWKRLSLSADFLSSFEVGGRYRARLAKALPHPLYLDYLTHFPPRFRNTVGWLLSITRDGFGTYNPRYMLWVLEGAIDEAKRDILDGDEIEFHEADAGQVKLVSCNHLHGGYVGASRRALTDIFADLGYPADLSQHLGIRRNRFDGGQLARLASPEAEDSRVDFLRNMVHAGIMRRSRDGYEVAMMFRPALKTT